MRDEELEAKGLRTDEGEKKGKGISRRDFLKGVGIGSITAAAITVAPSPEKAEAATIPKGVKEMPIQMEVNGKTYRLTVKSHWTLLDVLRKKLKLTGTKNSCDRGNCGACTIIMDGMTVYACSLFAIQADKHKIITIEALSDGDKLHPIQEAFIKEDALQCGFCTPAMIISTKALLDRKANPSIEEIKEALSGNICRCAAYPKILSAVKSLSQKA